VLALLVAVAGGAVLTAVAGARRTDTAYPRFLRASSAADVFVSPAGVGVGGYYGALARLPEVAAVAPVVVLNVQPGGRFAADAAGAEAPLDGRFGHSLEVPKVLAGRLPRPGRRDEIAVNQIGAARLHLKVGSSLTVRAIPNPGPSGAGGAGEGSARPRRLTERLVGVIVTRSSVSPVTNFDKAPFFLASTALWHYLGPGYVGADGAFVKLRPGTTPGAFGARAHSLARRFPRTGGEVFVADEGAQAAVIERSIRPEAVALALFAAVLAITALLAVGQAATRVLAARSLDNSTLAALGMTRGQLMSAGLIEVSVTAAVGAVAAAAVAVAASPLMPIGAARLAEPDPGISGDAPVLAVGAGAIVALLALRAAWPAWRLASAGAAGRRGVPAAAGKRSQVAAWLAGTGAPVTVSAGVRHALEPGRGRAAVRVRSALAGATLSVLAVTAAFTFGANLLHLVNTPRLYGQRWDVAVDFQFGTFTPGQAQRQLRKVAGVSGWTFGNHGIIAIGGLVVPAIGLTWGKGPLLSPTLLQGRPPRTSNEIVLGTSTLRRIGRRVGQMVTVTISGRRLTDRIVGRAAFPNFGQGGFTPTDLGQGAETTAAVLRPQLPGGRPGFEFALVRFAPGPRKAANIASFRRSMAGICQAAQLPACVVTDQRPNGILNYASIDRTPQLLAALLAVLGLAVLGQFVVVSGRQRRQDFAILKTLGLLRRQLTLITSWQVTTLTLLALLAGLPLGIAAGRWSWALFATSLGIPAGAITPASLILLMVPTVILIANAVAFWPGRATARLLPAQVLRTE
jgi:hypothetical protein